MPNRFIRVVAGLVVALLTMFAVITPVYYINNIEITQVCTVTDKSYDKRAGEISVNTEECGVLRINDGPTGIDLDDLEEYQMVVVGGKYLVTTRGIQFPPLDMYKRVESMTRLQ